MSCHTPGPWTVSIHGSEDRGDSVGVDDARGYPVIPPLNIAVADARLIAAAPDLLRELLQVRDAIIGPSIDRTSRDRLVTVGRRMELSLDRINAALAQVQS